VFEAILANAVRLCAASFGNLYLRDGDAFRLAALHNTPPAFVKQRRSRPYSPGPNSPPGRMLRTRTVVHVADLTADPSYLERDPGVVAFVELAGTRTVLLVPMLKDGEPIGYLNIDGVNTAVARLQSELADAQWDLDQTVTRPPAAGFVSQVALRPGMYVVPAPLRPAMVFVNTDPRDQEFAAAFQQNSLQRVKAGDEAEAAFDAVPGRVFKGKVRLVLDAIAAGQMQATGTLVDVGARTEGGRALAVIDIADDMSGYQIPLGAAAQVAIYAEHWHHVSLLRKAAHAQLAERRLP
jgi:hypothetical protein